MTRHTRNIDYSYTPRSRTTISRTQVRDGFVFTPRYNQINSSGREKSDVSGVIKIAINISPSSFIQNMEQTYRTLNV